MPSPDESVVTRTPNRYIAFKIKLNSQTRAGDISFDSDNTNDDSDKFNKGLDWESALYDPIIDGEEELVPLPGVGENDPGNNGEEGKEEENKEEGENDGDEVGGVENEEDETMVPAASSYHVAIFFDKDGKAIAPVLPLFVVKDDDKTKDSDEYFVYTYFYQPDEDEDSSFLASTENVLVVVNASDALVKQLEDLYIENLENDGATMADYQSIVLKPTAENPDLFYLRDQDGKLVTNSNGNPFLTMSSSMVIDDDKNVKAATEGELKLYRSEKEAKENPYVIYVERMQAKYTVIFKGANNKYYFITDNESLLKAAKETDKFVAVKNLFLFPPSDKDIHYVVGYEKSPTIDARNDVPIETTNLWKANIIGWGINGLEKEQYLFKKLDPTQKYVEQEWFAGTNRNFWAQDTHYSIADEHNYPKQYSKADDVEGIYDFETHKDEVTIDFFNFGELSKKGVRQYVPENTFSTQVYDMGLKTSKSHMRVGSHLIVTSQLLIRGFEYDGVYDSESFRDGLVVNYYNGVRDKYYMNNIYWDEPSYLNYVSEYLGYWMLTPENQKAERFGKNDGYFYLNENGVKASGLYFTVVPTNLKDGDGMVWVKPLQTLYSRNPENNEYTEIDPELYKTLAYEHQNYFAYRFYEGRMYYAWGSDHSMASPESNDYAEGDYGTVRNNWYYYTVDGITAPGMAVAYPDQEIIPNNGPMLNGMGVSISILDWHREFVNTDVSGQRPDNKKK